MCTDKKGHIWIADGATIVEFAHGGDHPIATLAAAGISAEGCAIDPLSGDLAVAGYPPSSQTPAVAIYRRAKGTPRVYDMPNSSSTTFCGYDDKGNLFVDGYGASPTYVITLAELLKGAQSLKQVSFKSSGGFPSFYPTPIQWDGKYITVGAVHAINRYVVKDYIATYRSATTFNEILELANSWIQGSRVVALNLFGSGSGSQIPAQIDEYPAGGNPIRIIDTKNLGNPFGVTVSRASQ
jgi:hypothetical protein